jgi:hypothetical protein|tara:strand:+ start:109 stop:462 length:354 start_codon:yes stop_codon:yes gene_type:complete
MTTEEAIDNVVGFLLDEYNVDVVFDDDEVGTYSPDARVIGINDTEPEEEQLFILLHEAGHAKIRRDKRKLSRFAEEEVAWMEGRHLAQTLKINIDQRSWASFYEKHLDDYRKWALTS